MNQLIIKLFGFILITQSFMYFEQDKPWKKINHSNYSFSYPAEWDLRFQRNSSKGFTIKMPGKDSPEVGLSVHKFPHRKNIDDLPIYYGDLETLPGYKIDTNTLDTTMTYTSLTVPSTATIELWTRIKIDTISDNGQRYIEAIHHLERPNKIYKRIWRIYHKNNSMYNLIFSCEINNWTTYKPDILKIFDSFKIK